MKNLKHRILIIVLSISIMFSVDSFAQVNRYSYSFMLEKAQLSSVKVIKKDIVGRDISSGSGVVILKGNIILTNCHVVDGGLSVSVISHNGVEYFATVVKFDRMKDLALLRISRKLMPIAITKKPVRYGDIVFVIGSPFGILNSVSMGIVSGIRGSYIQTDAALNHGNSGGMMIDSNGELVGIANMFMSPVDANIGLGFAIKIQVVKQFLKQ